MNGGIPVNFGSMNNFVPAAAVATLWVLPLAADTATVTVAATTPTATSAVMRRRAFDFLMIFLSFVLWPRPDLHFGFAKFIASPGVGPSA